MKLGATEQRGERILWSLFPPAWWAQERRIEARADELLGWLNMEHMRDDYAGTCSGGQRKLLELARALMAEPRLVMLDEPMAGVNPALMQSLLERIKELPARGMTVVFVEHDMDVVMDISDWVVVMGEGRIISEGPPDAVASDPAVIDAYIGKEHGTPSLAATDAAGSATEGER
jgi:neutral amino acid transport system ATP-binding protein